MRVEVVAGAAKLLFPEAGVGESEREGVGIALADKGFELGELALGGFAGGGFDFVQEGAHVGGRAHHLVDGGEVGPGAEAEEGGHLFARGEEVEQNLLVGGIAAVVVGEIHAAAELRAHGVGHDRRHVGRIGGEDYGRVGGEIGAVLVASAWDAVAGEVVVGKAEEVVGIVDGDFADVVLDGAAEGHAELRSCGRRGRGCGRGWAHRCRRRRGGSRGGRGRGSSGVAASRWR